MISCSLERFRIRAIEANYDIIGQQTVYYNIQKSGNAKKATKNFQINCSLPISIENEQRILESTQKNEIKRTRVQVDFYNTDFYAELPWI